MRLIHGLVLFVSALTLSQPAFAVDGVVEINQVKALAGGVTATDTAGFPVTIDAAGSYRLTSNLNNEANSLVVTITSSNVTLDLNGFTISACEAIDSSSSFVTVLNGILSGQQCDEPIILRGIGARVDRLRVDFGGVWLGSRCTLMNSAILGDTRLGSDCSLTNSTVRGGVQVGSRCLVSGNQIVGPAVATGILAGAGSRVLDNAVSDFYDDAISVSGGGCVVSGNAVRGPAYIGIEADGCVIENNNVTDIGQTGITGNGSVIKGNVVSGGYEAISANDATVIGNVAKDNSGEALLANASTGYKDNQFDNNNGGNANPQVSGGTEIGTNICGGDTTCP